MAMQVTVDVPVENENDVQLPLELVEDTLDLLLNPKRIISSAGEMVIDWDKRNLVFDRLFEVVKTTYMQKK